MPATAIAVQEGLDRVHPSTWRFDLTRQIRLFSSTDEVCVVFRLILDNAPFSAGRCSIHTLKQCSFAYYVLDGDVAKISGYLHASVAKGRLPSSRRVQVQRPQPRQMQEQRLHPRRVQAPRPSPRRQRPPPRRPPPAGCRRSYRRLDGPTTGVGAAAAASPAAAAAAATPATVSPGAGAAARGVAGVAAAASTSAGLHHSQLDFA